MFVLAPVLFNGASTAPSGAGPLLNGGYSGPAGPAMPDEVQPSRDPIAALGQYRPVFDGWPDTSVSDVSTGLPAGMDGVTKIVLAAIGGLVLGSMLKDMTGGKPA